jgi:lipoprotein-anchoring transpeptidase ErfK/SrfK
MALLAALMLGGCMQATLAPKPEAGWNTRDRELMSNLPYKQAAISEEFRRHTVNYSSKEAPGTIVVDSDNKFLYYVLPKGQAIRYGVTVGEEGQAWSGIAKPSPGDPCFPLCGSRRHRSRWC